MAQRTATPGRKPRPMGVLNDRIKLQRNEEIVLYRQLGWTLAKIGRKYGITAARVRQICNRHERDAWRAILHADRRYQEQIQLALDELRGWGSDWLQLIMKVSDD